MAWVELMSPGTAGGAGNVWQWCTGVASGSSPAQPPSHHQMWPALHTQTCQQWTIIRANIVWHGIENKEASLHPHCLISGNQFCNTFSCWIPNIPLPSIDIWLVSQSANLWTQQTLIPFCNCPCVSLSLIRIHLTVDSWKKSKSFVWDQTHVGAFLMNCN